MGGVGSFGNNATRAAVVVVGLDITDVGLDIVDVEVDTGNPVASPNTGPSRAGFENTFGTQTAPGSGVAAQFSSVLLQHPSRTCQPAHRIHS